MKSFNYQVWAWPCMLAVAATFCGDICLEAKGINAKSNEEQHKMKEMKRDREKIEKKIKEITTDYMGSIPDAPQVKIDAAGNAVVLWQEDGLYTLINASTSASLGGAWDTPVLLSDP